MVVWTVYFHGDGEFDWFAVFGKRREAENRAARLAFNAQMKWKHLSDGESPLEVDAEKYVAVIEREESHYFGA